MYLMFHYDIHLSRNTNMPRVEFEVNVPIYFYDFKVTLYFSSGQNRHLHDVFRTVSTLTQHQGALWHNSD